MVCNINDLTIGQLTGLQKLFPTAVSPEHPYILGYFYEVRTVTMIFTGKLVGIYAKELVLVDAAWVAHTGRYAQAVASGNYKEVEPFPNDQEVIIGRDAIISVTTIPKLPRTQQ